MKTKQTFPWLLSLLMLAIAPVFTSCSSDDDAPAKDPTLIVAGENDPLGAPIGLVYTDFITPNDVIHNADTTELTISKAFADKKGITNFVNHPMGIWDDQQHRAYLRRATEQRLVGDRYVLKVVQSTITEITGGQEMQLNTRLYYNPTRMVSRGGLTRASQGDPEADKYVDDNNIIHPAAITLRTKPNSGANSEDLDLSQAGTRTITIEQMFSGKTDGANSWFTDLWDDIVDAVEETWEDIVEATSYDWDDDKSWSLLKSKTTISKDIKFGCGKEPADTITLRFRCPIEFNLDYTLNIRSHGSIETAFVPVPSYLKTYIDGYFEANPQLRIGFSKTVTLPEDKQRIKLFQFSGIGYTFMIGPVPVSIDIDPSVYLKFTSTLMGNAYLGVQYDIATKFRVGMQYENGDLSGIAEGEKVKDEFSFINPRLELEAIAGVGLFFGVDVIIEKLGGPTFNIGPQVKVNAKLSYEMGDDRINASIEGKAGIGGEAGAKLKIFGFELADWRTYFDIGPQWTIFKYPDDGSGSSGDYDPNNGGGGNKHYYVHTFNITKSGSYYEPGHGPENLFDGSCETTWASYQTDWARNGSEEVSGEKCCWFEFEAVPAMKPKSYTLWTTDMSGEGWQYAARLPAAWRLYGKKDSSSKWVELHYQPWIELPYRNSTSQTFEISNPQECQFFRFEVYWNRDGSATSLVSLGQLVLNE